MQYLRVGCFGELKANVANSVQTNKVNKYKKEQTLMGVNKK